MFITKFNVLRKFPFFQYSVSGNLAISMEKESDSVTSFVWNNLSELRGSVRKSHIPLIDCLLVGFQPSNIALIP